MLLYSLHLLVIVHSEENLQVFHDHYGPSAREAYAHSSSTGNYNTSLHYRLSGLDRDAIFNIVKQATSLNLSNDISHQIIVISPARTRNDHTVSVPTLYLRGLIQQVLDDHVLEASARQFSVFNRVPKGKSIAYSTVTFITHYQRREHGKLLP